MLVSTRSGSTLPGKALGERDREPPGPRVVVGQPVDHRLERDDARGGDHARLAHPAAEARPVFARRCDRVGGTAEQRPDRRRETLRQAEHHRVGLRREHRGRHAERDRRVPDARAVAVHREPAAHARGRSPRRAPPGATAGRSRACACSRSTTRRSRAGGAAATRCSGRCRRRTAGRRHRARGRSCTPRVPRGGGVLVAVHVGALAAEHLGAGPPEQPERELVRHRSRRHVERGFLAEERRRERLEPAHGRVLAVRVVAHFGVGDGAPHLRRGRGDGVGTEVDGSRW